MTFSVNTLWIFVMVAAIQLFVPGYMIHRYENTLLNGKPYWFKVGPVDPYDPFRGKYVRVNVEANSAPVAPDAGIKAQQWIYVTLGEDSDGFATLLKAETTPPAETNYLKVRAQYINGKTVRVEMPFQRYYAEEKIAPEIERAYQRNSSRGRQEATLLVRVKKGVGVIEELYIEGMPVRDYLEKNAVNQ